MLIFFPRYYSLGRKLFLYIMGLEKIIDKKILLFLIEVRGHSMKAILTFKQSAVLSILEEEKAFLTMIQNQLKLWL